MDIRSRPKSVSGFDLHFLSLSFHKTLGGVSPSPLEMAKLMRLRELRSFAQDHTARKQLHRDGSPGLSGAKALSVFCAADSLRMGGERMLPLGASGWTLPSDVTLPMATLLWEPPGSIFHLAHLPSLYPPPPNFYLVSKPGGTSNSLLFF